MTNFEKIKYLVELHRKAESIVPSSETIKFFLMQELWLLKPKVIIRKGKENKFWVHLLADENFTLFGSEKKKWLVEHCQKYGFEIIKE